jgi:hypothetical protein
MRSEPGKGRQVELFHAWLDEWDGGYLTEDYANAVVPLCVKVDPSFPKAEVITLLRELANHFAVHEFKKTLQEPRRSRSPQEAAALEAWQSALRAAHAGRDVSIPF